MGSASWDLSCGVCVVGSELWGLNLGELDPRTSLRLCAGSRPAALDPAPQRWIPPRSAGSRPSAAPRRSRQRGSFDPIPPPPSPRPPRRRSPAEFPPKLLQLSFARLALCPGCIGDAITESVRERARRLCDWAEAVHSSEATHTEDARLFFEALPRDG